MDHHIVYPSIKDLITKLSLLGFTLLLFLGCENNSRVDCSLVLCVGQLLAIELVSTQAVNLTTNETYSLENIKVFKDSTQVSSREDTTSDAILISVFGEKGNNT
jgi:hypothetical protein